MCARFSLCYAADFRSACASMHGTCMHLRINPSRGLSHRLPYPVCHPWWRWRHSSSLRCPFQPSNPGCDSLVTIDIRFSLAAASCVTFLPAYVSISHRCRALISIKRSILCHVPSVHSLGRHSCSIISLADEIQRYFAYYISPIRRV